MSSVVANAGIAISNRDDYYDVKELFTEALTQIYSSAKDSAVTLDWSSITFEVNPFEYPLNEISSPETSVRIRVRGVIND